MKTLGEITKKYARIKKEEINMTYGVMAIYRTILIEHWPIRIVEREHGGDTVWYHVHRGDSPKMSNCIGTLR